MIDLATFEVVGLPAPQGSKTKMPNGAMLEAGSKTGRENHRSWRQAVADTARNLRLGPPMDGPVAIRILFRFPMPASRPAAVRKAGVGWHCVKPDKDKLLRTVFDSLKTAGVVKDDARICWEQVAAVEIWEGWTGAVITIGVPGPIHEVLR